ncbi:hypothetical protein EIN_023800 [Entamoeba invadens IP1]|uniref:hypothetical protein n=1 Tax=Entamoeba invadens IP1 TaxID=370355 RepID=UPI0002C3DCD6|nr:hypothetical protein EIN_023800 [Entamoeba invadens IP1]ELP90681.1 hypothetical protein EIN_023800 [Entamoeba invadens IP1]|eukprot:XP_004257452.1 hypothetical protein EIN_023800 [Entamoeba invadens IP1]
MNYIKLQLSLVEYFESLFPPNEKQLDYFLKRALKGGSLTITKKIHSQVKNKHTISSFKALLLYHHLSKNGVTSIYGQIPLLVYSKGIEPFQPDYSKLMTWGEMYSNVVDKDLQFHKKYNCFDGRFQFVTGTTFPDHLNNREMLNLLDEDIFNLFKEFNTFLITCFNQKAENVFITQALEFCSDEVFNLFGLLEKVTTALFEITHEENETHLNWCFSQLDFVRNNLSTIGETQLDMSKVVRQNIKNLKMKEKLEKEKVKAQKAEKDVKAPKTRKSSKIEKFEKVEKHREEDEDQKHKFFNEEFTQLEIPQQVFSQNSFSKGSNKLECTIIAD